jgi:beta-xylosidase
LTHKAAASAPPWRDASLDTGTRVAALIAQVTLEEKIVQLYGVWVGVETSGSGVAPTSTISPVSPSTGTTWSGTAWGS